MNTAAWAQLYGEPEDAYRAFGLYIRSAPPRLPPAMFASACSVAPWTLLDWFRVWRWEARVAAFDAWYDAEIRAKHEAVAQEPAESILGKNKTMLAAARELAMDQLAKHLAQARSRTFPSLKPPDLVRIMRYAIQLNRELEDPMRGAGEVDVSETWGDDLSDAELQQYDQIVAKATGQRKVDIE